MISHQDRYHVNDREQLSYMIHTKVTSNLLSNEWHSTTHQSIFGFHNLTTFN